MIVSGAFFSPRLTDEDLERRARKGDRDARSDLFERLRPRVTGCVRRKFSSLSDDDLADVVQDASTVVDSHIQAGKFRWECSVSSYWCTVANNDALDLCRKMARQKGMSLEEQEAVASPEPDPTEAVLQKDQFSYCLEQLTPYQRSLLALRFTEFLRLQDIAAIVRKSVAQISRDVSHAQTTLQACVEGA